ncbi:hypothetical protein F2P47_10795 [Parvibaculum sedimenti]|uniref:Uncharacterized protein n=2 Tax=Parvibaculum sedimenti TaxID=2608632 RepID=A0A6N6VJG6_9HYPH|nr:hypothetical protein [Parvibaculum sedimenti]KAB7739980.1 hypothetical protein F2P47_10795 [Parvibaculum sedimenti]
MTAAPRIVFEALTGAETLAAHAWARAGRAVHDLAKATLNFNPGDATAAAIAAFIGFYGLAFVGHAFAVY